MGATESVDNMFSGIENGWKVFKEVSWNVLQSIISFWVNLPKEVKIGLTIFFFIIVILVLLLVIKNKDEWKKVYWT